MPTTTTTTWTIDAVVLDRYATPLPPCRTDAPTLAGALRAFARHARAHGVRWQRRGVVLRLTISRSRTTTKEE